MKGYFKNMKTITKVDFATYLGVILAFIGAVMALMNA